MNDPRQEWLRALPAVDRLATAAARAELERRRRALLDGDDPDGAALAELTAARIAPDAPRVLNATGVVLHTNLGRAPLAPEARAAIDAAAAGYSALELDLSTGRRDRRGRRAELMVTALTGASGALIVNNGAAAVLLCVAALAGPGREVIVSRGELVEIGGGLRIADIVAQSGATLVEVGSTNRTRTEDYATVIGPRTGAILRVHQSNFRMSGYAQQPQLSELTRLGVPVIDDLGSGAIRADDPLFEDEPAVRSSLDAGATLVCFSGDKLLGGPQAGILAGAAEPVARCRTHPLARALRIDKLCLAGLEATLELLLDPASAARVPVRAMLGLDRAELDRRTGSLAELTGGAVIESAAAVGGGSLPLHELAGPAVAIDPGPGGAEAFAARLRSGTPPVLARIAGGRVVLSARTLAIDELPLAARCVQRARG